MATASWHHHPPGKHPHAHQTFDKPVRTIHPLHAAPWQQAVRGRLRPVQINTPWKIQPRVSLWQTKTRGQWNQLSTFLHKSTTSAWSGQCFSQSKRVASVEWWQCVRLLVLSTHAKLVNQRYSRELLLKKETRFHAAVAPPCLSLSRIGSLIVQLCRSRHASA